MKHSAVRFTANNIQISAANSHDLETLNRLMYRLHDEHHQQVPQLFKTAQEIEQEKSIALYLDDPSCFVYVARMINPTLEREIIIGFVTGHFCELISSVSKPVLMGSIDELYVLPEHRQCGVARQLCQRIERSFTECGVTQSFVEVWHFNASAQAFYHEQGFEHHIHWLRKPLAS